MAQNEPFSAILLLTWTVQLMSFLSTKHYFYETV